MADHRCLFLMRHATASNETARDHARPLSEAGRIEARAVGRDWPGELPWPDFALCSDAERTRETMGILAEIRPFAQARAEAELYLGMPDRLLARIHATPASVRCLLLVGHNPGIHQLALELAPGPEAGADPALRHALTQGFAPASLCALAWPERMDWAEIAAATARLAAVRGPQGWRIGGL